ncbi:hypothetical protein LMG28688_06952 [Paraburkholderia caffeinitolerans]|uniref:DUF676 domain-containing protein n=4 Tax=Paraburkholderia caffeinitolerans TaxID=1723730 RepID=A0A6J5H213_9BURK|nr:hypothetical protein LMG28688_06952 [Paraburkholderia caffeinitolerans]
MGKLEAPFILRSIFQNPKKHVVLQRVTEYDVVKFGQEISAAPYKGDTRKALIFIHGFHTTFEDAARRAAQIARDVESSGVPFVYSWPSGSKLLKYTSDGSNAEQAVLYFKEFISTIINAGNFDEVVILAHSMGNRVLAGAITAMKAAGLNHELQRITEVIFAAPDIDADVFENQIAPALTNLAVGTTLYVSSGDKALAASEVVNGAPRAGDAGEAILVVNGVDTVDASAIESKLFSLNHSYIGSSQRLISDLNALIEKRMRAAHRFGLLSINVAMGKYWRFKV